MKMEKNFADVIFDFCNVIVMILLMIATLYPFWHVLMASFSDGTELLMHTGAVLYPIKFTLDTYAYTLQNSTIYTGYLNTIIIVSVSLVFNFLLTSIGAYVLSRKNVKLKNAIMAIIIFTMYFNGGLIPNYFNIKDLLMYNTLWSLIIPGAISTYNMIILRTSFEALPDSLEESAKLDGASHFTILFRIIVPLSKAALAVVLLYYGVAHWNAWFNAMIYLSDANKYPLQLILREIVVNNTAAQINLGDPDKLGIAENIKYVTIIIATVPILLVYPFLQKYFVKGVLIGAVKG